MGVLIPTALHQCPQIFCEGWMRGPWRAPASGYSQHSHGSRKTNERNLAGEYLCWSETTMGRSVVHNWSPVTYLDHDHSERENVSLLAIWPFVQYLRCSPSRGQKKLRRGSRLENRFCGDRNLIKICDPRMAGGIYKDIWLDMHQHGSKTGVRTTTYSLEIPVNHIAGVEVTKSLRDVG